MFIVMTVVIITIIVIIVTTKKKGSFETWRWLFFFFSNWVEILKLFIFIFSLLFFIFILFFASLFYILLLLVLITFFFPLFSPSFLFSPIPTVSICCQLYIVLSFFTSFFLSSYSSFSNRPSPLFHCSVLFYRQQWEIVRLKRQKQSPKSSSRPSCGPIHRGHRAPSNRSTRGVLSSQRLIHSSPRCRHHQLMITTPRTLLTSPPGSHPLRRCSCPRRQCKTYLRRMCHWPRGPVF